MANFLSGFFSLGKDINKVEEGFREERKEGIIDVPTSELTLDKEDKELLELKRAWEKKWEDSKLKEQIELRQKENEKYWLGDHHSSAQKKVGQRDSVNNLIFEAVETFLPAISRQIAEPLIKTSPEEAAQFLAKKVADKIIDIADVIRLRLKIRKAIRYWTIYFLGALKIGWSLKQDEINVEAIRPQQLILDPDAITDECEYIGEYIGHFRKDSAKDLIKRFPKKSEEIKEVLGKDNLGTRLRYVEWWTNDFVFWTMKDIVLDKAKNPHWNYDQEQTEVEINELGEPITKVRTIQGRNHFSVRKMPFAFLSVFNLGKGPFDDTNLIEQILPLQDIVNKRIRQIDKNADNTNGGAIVSGEHFSKEQASQVGEALRKGQTIWVPTGDVNRAYKREMGSPLPNFVYQNLLDSRDQIRGNFGITGLSAQGIKSEETVRGKIIIKGQDIDRNSLIVDQIEQLYDYIFNWFVQMMIVYYDTPRTVTSSVNGEPISTGDFIRPLVVSVKEGSLIPRDRLTLRNEAVDLWAAKAISAEELFEKLEFPNPKESAKRLLIWQMIQQGQLPPQVLFPDFPITADRAIAQEAIKTEIPEETQKIEEQPNLLSNVPIT